METQSAIKLIRELKANKFLPKYNVKEKFQSLLINRTKDLLRFAQKYRVSLCVLMRYSRKK